MVSAHGTVSASRRRSNPKEFTAVLTARPPLVAVALKDMFRGACAKNHAKTSKATAAATARGGRDARGARRAQDARDARAARDTRDTGRQEQVSPHMYEKPTQKLWQSPPQRRDLKCQPRAHKPQTVPLSRVCVARGARARARAWKNGGFDAPFWFPLMEPLARAAAAPTQKGSPRF